MPATILQIQQIIADNNLNSVADVYSLLRDSGISSITRNIYLYSGGRVWAEPTEKLPCC